MTLTTITPLNHPATTITSTGGGKTGGGGGGGRQRQLQQRHSSPLSLHPKKNQRQIDLRRILMMNRFLHMMMVAMIMAPVAAAAVEETANDNAFWRGDGNDIPVVVASDTETTNTNAETNTNTESTTTTTTTTTTKEEDTPVVVMSHDTPFLERLAMASKTIQWDNETQVAAFLANEVAIRQATSPSPLLGSKDDDPGSKLGRGEAAQRTSKDTRQVFFIDFDTATNAGEIIYSSDADRNFILNRLTEDYNPFYINFTTTRPSQGPYSIITVNDGPMGVYAKNSDVLNLDWIDNATVNANGMGFAQGSPEVVYATGNLIARAVGYLLGLRNGDCFGPPGKGLPSTGKPKPSDYFPNYTGPYTADETTKHTMASAGSVGQTSVELSTQKTYLSERSIIKLSFVAGRGKTMTEAAAKNKNITLPQMILKNSLKQGINSGRDYLSLRGLMITDGSVYGAGEMDEYHVNLVKDMRLTVEVASNHNANIVYPFISRLRLIKMGDTSTNIIAENQRGFDGLDSILLDVIITETGTYKIVVEAVVLSGNPAGGYYDLWIYAIDPDTFSTSMCPANDACIRKRHGGILGGINFGSGNNQNKKPQNKVRVARMIHKKCRTFCTNFAPRWEKLLKFGCDRCDNWL